MHNLIYNRDYEETQNFDYVWVQNEQKNSFSILKVEYLDNLYKLHIFLGNCFGASIYVLYPKKIGLLTTSYSSRRALTSKNM